MILPQLVTAATAVAGAATVVLSAASISNIVDTYSLVRRHNQQEQLQSSKAHLEAAAPWTSVDEAVDALTNMKKKDLVELFLRCEPPSDLGYIDDEECWLYDGYLLDVGPILTPVTNFITNRLFGRGKKWLGKGYFRPAATGVIGTGKNRFSSHNNRQNSRATSPIDEVLDRKYDYSVEESKLGKSSLFQRYAPHCPKLSPFSLVWGGMVDELRELSLVGSSKSDEQKAILIGMGYFSWSGGAWNVSPFCLVPRKSATLHGKFD